MTTTRYLIIDKVNEVYLKIEAEADIRRELGEFFTFEVPGYKFMPQYRNRVWDGKIRLFSYATGKIYAGLYPYIKKLGLGQLPGDIMFKSGNSTFFFPIVTCIIISVVLTIIFNLFK